ncbi:C2 calcium-dependent domain-containing protein 4D [Emydura macquarii macquarii]|uniref:C2 calcium-dependent domain-containing protein 4D n=1 Tax=Emydura macquarii macquarii TaxID=1129001 RepID=UPI00352B39C8
MFLSRRRAVSKEPWPLPACPNVLTPDRIPKFFIPPQLSTQRGRAPCGSPDSQWSPQGSGSPEALRARSRAGTRHIIRIESLAQDSTARTVGEAGQLLRAARSMPHLTSPGDFPLLPESPHTLRRESLFHATCPPHWISPNLSPEAGARLSPLELRRCQPFSQPGALDSDTASSAGSSPFGSPRPGRSPDRQAHGGRPLCRRPLAAQAPGRAHSLSTEETSSTDASPSFSRRGTGPGWGAGASLAPPPFFLLDFSCRPVQVARENTVALTPRGHLRLSSEYVAASQRLRVRLVSGEGLYPRPCHPRHLGCCVALQLRPGPGPKQRSVLVRRSCSPIFNEDFFFEGLAPHELPARSLRLKALGKRCGVGRDAVLGKAEVPLPALLPP